jgi:hypothetical protein
MDKYATHYKAWSKLEDFYATTIPSPSTEISNKLIKKSELSTYSLKLSSTPKKQYTDNQCVLERDIVPSYTDKNITEVRLQTGNFGLLDSTLEGSLFYVTKEGPWEVEETIYENTNESGGIESYRVFSPHKDSTYPVLIPPADNKTHVYTINGCKGSEKYIAAGKSYVKYGIGLDLTGSFYSYFSNDNEYSEGTVHVDAACDIEFWDGRKYKYIKSFKPIVSTPVRTDGSNTVYEHDICISFNRHISTTDIGIANSIDSGFIDCGTGNVKRIIFTLDVYGAP